MRVQIVRDVDGKGVLDRPIEKEEQPGEDDQAEQVVTAQEAEAGFCCLRVDRLRGRRGCGVRAPGLGAEEGERGGVKRE
jgi:hypothetical protein